jgi:hypothetical protein
MKPEIIVPYEPGQQNADLAKANQRLSASGSYKDLSTVIVTPTRGGRSLCPRFVGSLLSLMRPMNQKCFGPVFMSGMEVGKAFNSAIEMILSHPELNKFKFLMTIEDDNIVPPDCMLKLYESMREFDVVGSLYWTKGEGGQPMIYGNPHEMPLNFIPQPVQSGMVQRCNGVGMGATLFKMELFKKIPAPWFETVQDWDPNKGGRGYTQDLAFCEKVCKIGGRIAVDTRVKVGHLDIEAGHLW